MFTQAEIIVALWFLPVILHIILPLTVLLGWLLTKPFRKDRQAKPAAREDRATQSTIGLEAFSTPKS